jgi:hypothetical protein
MGSRDARIAENEALFRAMNESMAEWDERRDAPATEKHLFFCECCNRICHERVCLTIPEYTAVRESPMRFVVLPGHVFPDLESVVETREAYLVVEKFERFRRIIDEAAPFRPRGQADAGGRLAS